MYKIVTSEKVIQEQFKDFFEKDWVLDVWHIYQFTHKKTNIDIVFTKDRKALWIMKYKGKYYGDAMTNIEEKDGLTYIDIYTTFVEQAIATINGLKK